MPDQADLKNQPHFMQSNSLFQIIDLLIKLLIPLPLKTDASRSLTIPSIAYKYLIVSGVGGAEVGQYISEKEMFFIKSQVLK